MSTPLVHRSPRHVGRVVAVADLTPRMRRVTVRSPGMVDVPVRAAQDVELFLREESGRRVKRRYTIRHSRSGIGEIDLDVLLHGHGPGSAWASTTAPGDAVEFQGPRGKLAISDAPWHLLAGDEAALPAIAAVSEALSTAQRTIAVIEVADSTDEIPITGADVRWVHRAGAPAGSVDLLAATIATMPLPPGDGHGYLMGETRAMVTLRSVVAARGIAHDAIFVKGYWNLGRPDRIAGRSPA